MNGDKNIIQGYAGQGQEKRKSTGYRTREKAGEIDRLPDRIAVTSVNSYLGAKNSYAYLEMADKKKPKPAMALAEYIYSVYLEKYKNLDDLDDFPQEWLQKEVAIYLPDLKKMTGKSGDAVIAQLDEYCGLVGVFPGDGGAPDQRLPVMDYRYDKDRNVITVTSPYFMALIKKVEKARIEKRMKNPRRYRGESLPAGYSRRIKPEIIKERNNRAVEIVRVITLLIDMAGTPLKRDEQRKLVRDKAGDPVIDEKRVAHISFREVIRRCSELDEAYRAAPANNRKRVLERAFMRAGVLLAECTDLKDVYKDLRIPDLGNKKYIPGSTGLDKILEFPHREKFKKR